MGFSKGYNELQTKIHYQKTYIETLLNFHPAQLDNWLQEQEREFRCVAKECADGDKEIEYSAMSCQQTMLDPFEDGKYIFYNSMLLIVYSYYECMTNHIAKISGAAFLYAKDTVSNICEINSITFPDHICADVKYIEQYVKILRNHIAHNNDGTTNAKAEDDLNNLVSLEPDIELYDGQVQIKGISFICRILKMEYDILMYIAQNIDKTIQ